MGEKVFVKVSPTKGVFRFGKRGKLNPRYVGPFEILEKVGRIAYRLALPHTAHPVHKVFHISLLCKYVSDLSHILSYEDIEVRLTKTYEEELVRILKCRDKQLRTKVVPLVKVLWSKHGTEAMTWESEADRLARFP